MTDSKYYIQNKDPNLMLEDGKRYHLMDDCGNCFVAIIKGKEDV